LLFMLDSIVEVHVSARDHGMLTDLLSMRAKMDRVLGHREAELHDDRGAGPSASWRPEVDVIESDEEFIVQVELPGLAREHFTLTIEGRDLILEGERQSAAHLGQARRLQMERRYGSFRRTISLPAEVKDDAISATLVDGVLEITIPKKSKPESRRVVIQTDTVAGPHG
jgi:HSP20 family protein